MQHSSCGFLHGRLGRGLLLDGGIPLLRARCIATFATTTTAKPPLLWSHAANGKIVATPMTPSLQRFDGVRPQGLVGSSAPHFVGRSRSPIWVPIASLSSSPFGGGRGGGGGTGNRLAQGVGVLGAASVLLGKSKYLLGALKLTKLASLGSMVFTVGAYSAFFGLPYAAGMVGLILVHECGHALVMIHRKLPFSPMVFVPFMGAFIAMREQPRDAWEDALVAFGGPVLGGAGAGAVALAAAATHSQLLHALADFGFMINLFNLLPIGAMDGGRIAGALSPYAGVVGLGLGGMLAYNGVVQNPIFYLILLAGGWETFQRFYNPGASTPPHYYKITPLQRGILTASYAGLVTALVAGMAANHRHQKPPDVLEREKMWDARF